MGYSWAIRGLFVGYSLGYRLFIRLQAIHGGYLRSRLFTVPWAIHWAIGYSSVYRLFAGAIHQAMGYSWAIRQAIGYSPGCRLFAGAIHAPGYPSCCGLFVGL
jgi:hypothetical protein